MSEQRLCPACDFKLNEGDSACSQCGVPLGIFDDEMNSVGLPAADGEAQIQKLLQTIDDVQESDIDAVVKTVKGIGLTAPKIEDVFACPSCGATVPASAASCPGCGAQFVEESSSQFQCPECKTMVDGNAEKCPGCGAQFVEEKTEGDASGSDDASAGTGAADTEKDGEKPAEKAGDDKKVKKKKKDDLWSKFIKKKK